MFEYDPRFRHRSLAEGFDISGSKLLFDNFLPLAGYLAAWAVLAYYLVKSREIAS